MHEQGLTARLEAPSEGDGHAPGSCAGGALPFTKRSSGGTVCSAGALVCDRPAAAEAAAGAGAGAAMALGAICPASLDVGSARKCRRPPYHACTPDVLFTFLGHSTRLISLCDGPCAALLAIAPFPCAVLQAARSRARVSSRTHHSAPACEKAAQELTQQRAPQTCGHSSPASTAWSSWRSRQ